MYTLEPKLKAFGYPKTEKLKKKKHIGLLFSEGKSVSMYPLRLVFVPIIDTEEPFQVGVSVSKRYFKKATDRNYIKRLMREAYRLNKNILPPNLKQSYAIMFLYQSKDKPIFVDIQEKMILVMEKFLAEISD